MSDEQLQFLLQTLHENIEGIKSSAVVSAEGLIIQSILEEGISDIKLAAMTATILSASAHRTIGRCRSPGTLCPRCECPRSSSG